MAWNENIIPVDFLSVLQSFEPRSVHLSEMADEYLSLRVIDLKPPRIALNIFLLLAGDRDVSEYNLEDAKLFNRHLMIKENKTPTIRRRINILSVIINYACSELDLDKCNPFTRLMIKGEGDDALKRDVITKDQLRQGFLSKRVRRPLVTLHHRQRAA